MSTKKIGRFQASDSDMGDLRPGPTGKKPVHLSAEVANQRFEAGLPVFKRQRPGRAVCNVGVFYTYRRVVGWEYLGQTWDDPVYVSIYDANEMFEE